MLKPYFPKKDIGLYSTFKVRGMVKLECRDRFGNLLWNTPYSHNIITNTGRAAITGLLSNLGSIPAFGWLAVGTSSTAEAATQTALVAEITTNNLGRAAATVSRTTTTVTNDTMRLTYTWTASGTSTIEEVGLFNASSAGTMLGRKLTGSKTVNNTELLTATYDIIVG